MEKMLDAIKFEGDFNFFENLDTLGFQQIKALMDAIVMVGLGDTRDFLIEVLNEKVAEVDQCVKRLTHEMIEARSLEREKAALKADTEPEHAK